ncbi:hypothetical protein SESBI_03324 [Sesbania bispinosa]|nr:hypothetical protein SESBI_03324 [Sesbania bispinosa]
MADPYGFILELSRIPPLQEQLLQRIPFVRYTCPLLPDDSIVMLSLPNTQDAPPPDPQLPIVDDVDTTVCVLNRAGFEAYDWSEGYVDFSRFSFSGGSNSKDFESAKRDSPSNDFEILGRCSSKRVKLR